MAWHPAGGTAAIIPSDLIVLGRETRLKLPMRFFPAALRNGRLAIVGRSAQCEIAFTDHTVSAFHARIVVGDCTTEVEDLVSTNGTRLIDEKGKSRKLPPLTATSIAGSVEIAFGKFKLAVDSLNSTIRTLDVD